MATDLQNYSLDNRAHSRNRHGHEKAGVPSKTIGLVQVRASQINGCSVCVDMHCRELKKAGETDERLFTVAAWRDAPHSGLLSCRQRVPHHKYSAHARHIDGEWDSNPLLVLHKLTCA